MKLRYSQILFLAGGFVFGVSGLAAPQKIQGVVEGFGELRNDDVLDLAVVLPSVKEEQVLGFDFAGLFSPNEELRAGPQSAEVPGNVFAPRQRESYGWFPLTIRKESFSVMHEAGTQAELFTIAVQAPFNDLVGLARRNASDRELLRLIRFNSLGFEVAQDWSALPGRLTTRLGYERPKRTTLSWQRSRYNSQETDMVLQLEETPLGRYIISDFDMDPSTSTNYQATDFDSEVRLMAGRAQFDQNDDLEMMRAHLIDHARGDSVRVSGVPEKVENVSVSEGRVLRWKADGRSGFVNAFVERKTATQVFASVQKVMGEIFFPDLGDWGRAQGAERVLMNTWVPFESGQLELGSVLGQKDSCDLIFLLGSNMEVPSLKKATELLVINVK